MNVYELLAQLKRVQYQAAVVDEMSSYLQKLLDDDTEIPVDIEDGRVPNAIILEMIASLGEQRDTLLQKLEIAEQAEVTGVSSQDFNIS